MIYGEMESCKYRQTIRGESVHGICANGEIGALMGGAARES